MHYQPYKNAPTSATLLLRMLISFRSRIIVHLSKKFYFLGSDCSYMSPGARAGTRMSEDIWHCAEWGWPKRNLASLLASRRMFRGNCCFQNLLFPENGIVEPQGIDPGSKPAVERLGEEQACRLGAGWNISQPQNLLCHKCFFTPWQFVLIFPKEVDYTIPHICHGGHGRRPCKFFLAGVNFYRFNGKNWQFTV